MRILFFVSSMHAGGAERVAATLASAWASRGDTIRLVPTYTGKGTCFYTLHPGVQLDWLADRMGWLGRVCPPLAKWFAMRRLVQEFRPDVVLSFLTNVNVMVLLATHKLGVPVIVSERTNAAYSTSAGAVFSRLRRWLYPWASLVVLQSRHGLASFKKLEPGVHNLAVMPNPLPPSMPEPPEPRAQSPGSRRQLMAMGRMVPSKRFASLIEAFASLSGAFPDWDLTIWGEGPLRPELERLVQALGLSGRVLLPGRTEAPWEALAQADAFALVSEVEGFPNVLIEAMALGRACVTVDCPSGPREITRDGQFAELVPLHDTQALEDALARLMRDPLLREVMGRRAAAWVRQHYGIAEILARWDALFEETGRRHSERIHER
ncbi:glycosyltransferase family 4 protein [Allopusillimonas soli]|uniref:Glycosyltransferase family 4 protein n=1 Tax=Allopusillimonas soli TaxID=659016 RepID=A0A853F6X5_9BURK|nr:glycosyltransferase family 4 protein [Allopusillimonas soli]NYT35727.1 glycosyltransferase family 4 protein [Allopusillimonas soli]TEA76116.1 glycosyltransferase family 4 protein [Allopusillimonas soli]